jgi:hypothetical protein
VHSNKILIPLAPDSRDLKALHHAISLAERIESRIFVLSFEPEADDGNQKSPVIEACLDVIHSACENGLNLSFFIIPDHGERAETEFLKFLNRENIDLVIISDAEIQVEKMIRKLMPLISCQIVQVKKKNNIKYL